MHSLYSVFHDDIQGRERARLMVFSKTKTIYKQTIGKMLKKLLHHLEKETNVFICHLIYLIEIVH